MQHSATLHSSLLSNQGKPTPSATSSASPDSGHVLLDVHPAPPRITTSPKRGDAHPASCELANADSSELSSRPAAPEGQVTRVEITFEKLWQESLYSRDHDSLIQQVAQRLSTSPKWLEAYRAQKFAAVRGLFYGGSGYRKIRFVERMNVIIEEAPKFGLDVPYTHQLHYGRYYYDGWEWNPDSFGGRTLPTFAPSLFIHVR